MKTVIAILVPLVLVAAGIGGYYLYAKKAEEERQANERARFEAHQARLREAEKHRAREITYHQTIEANSGIEYHVDVPVDMVPGMLFGNWDSKGSSAKIKGAADDSLVFFKLAGPNSEQLQRLDHPTEGNFSYRVTTPGRYTFLFDNRGTLRSSARQVSLKGTYKPD